jgi:hypothetical protein
MDSKSELRLLLWQTLQSVVAVGMTALLSKLSKHANISIQTARPTDVNQ